MKSTLAALMIVIGVAFLAVDRNERSELIAKQELLLEKSTTTYAYNRDQIQELEEHVEGLYALQLATALSHARAEIHFLDNLTEQSVQQQRNNCINFINEYEK